MSLGSLIASLVSRRTAKETTGATLEQREKERRQSLAMSELPERLRKHQEAYVLWFRIRDSKIHNLNDDLLETLEEARNWLINNGLYLDSRARYALWDCIHFAGIYHNTLECSKQAEGVEERKNQSEELKRQFRFIRHECGAIIEKCVDLPGFAQQDMLPDIDPTGEETSGG